MEARQKERRKEKLSRRPGALARLRQRSGSVSRPVERRCSLRDRKAALADLLEMAPNQILFSEHLACDGPALFAKVGELCGAGIVSKRIDAPYTSHPGAWFAET